MASNTPGLPGLASPRDVLIRLSGEVTTKGRRTRVRFQRGLARNLRAALDRRDLSYKINEDWSRLYLIPERDEQTDVASSGLLDEVFGISSYSPIDAECEANLDQIVETGSRIYSDRVEGRSFAVRARRSGQHGFRSRDVMVELGYSSKLNAEWEFLCMLRDEGRRAGDAFLTAHHEDLGRRSTFDLDELLKGV